MSLRAQIKKEGEYPSTQYTTRAALKIDNKTIILTTYETAYSINIYLGGVKHWCIHTELLKDGDKMKEEGYLIKIRYDMLCSVEENIQRGGVHRGDMTKLLNLLIQYIHDTYPDVTRLIFNDLSVRVCDNGTATNLAVMTYLYTEKTWYEKNFDASVAPQSKKEFDAISAKLNESKSTLEWEVIKNTINNYQSLPYTEPELEQLYKGATTWKEFFEPIKDKIDIHKFCIFVSPWLDSFIVKYFNTLMGISYSMPIKERPITYTKNTTIGGRYKSFFKGARKNKTIKRFSEF
jgi:hypothetical protein